MFPPMDIIFPTMDPTFTMDLTLTRGTFHINHNLKDCLAERLSIHVLLGAIDGPFAP